MRVVIPASSTVLAVFVYHGILLVMEYGIARVEQTNPIFVATQVQVRENLFLS
jgi:hypothetical protein